MLTLLWKKLKIILKWIHLLLLMDDIPQKQIFIHSEIFFLSWVNVQGVNFIGGWQINLWKEPVVSMTLSILWSSIAKIVPHFSHSNMIQWQWLKRKIMQWPHFDNFYLPIILKVLKFLKKLDKERMGRYSKSFMEIKSHVVSSLRDIQTCSKSWRCWVRLRHQMWFPNYMGHLIMEGNSWS